MAAQWFYALGAVSMVAGLIRAAQVGWSHPEPRTLLVLAAIFVIVSACLMAAVPIYD